MRTIRRSQMEVFEGETLEDFKESFNKVMLWLSNTGYKHTEPEIDLVHLRGIVLYETVLWMPEDLKDEYELKGVVFHCPDCEKYCPLTLKRGSCQYVKGELKDTDECCKRFWERMGTQNSWLVGREEDLLEKDHEFGCPSESYGVRRDADRSSKSA